MMKIILFILLIPSAFALNQTFLRMPPDIAYMNFAMKKYLDWHRKHFSFPEENETISKVVSKIDHWTLGSPYIRQITMTHYADEKARPAFRLRLFVHPDLRKMKDFSGKGLPAKEVMFAEWDSNGRFCQLFQEAPQSFSSYCKNSAGTYSLSWTEKAGTKLPDGWRIPFPVLGEEFVQKEISGEIQELYFFEVTPHPSIIPKPLLRSVFLHTKETLFPLDRMGHTRDGKISIHYP